MTKKELIQGLPQQESGQDMLEYSLVVAAIMLAVVAGSQEISTVINDGIAKVIAKITTIIK